MKFESTLDGKGLRVAVVTAQFNEVVTKALSDGALRGLRKCGVTLIDTAEVPGARELGVVVRRMALTGRYDAIIALGCVIRGETIHFDLVAQEASSALSAVALETGIPIGFGVLACENLEQALNRAGGKMGNAGEQAAFTVVESAGLIERVEKAD